MILIGIILMIAACVQGSIGFGLGMLAAPLIALMRPDLLPALILLLAMGLSTATFIRDRGTIEWKVVGWSTVGRVPGTVLGAAAVALLPVAGLHIVLAFAVILGTASSLIGWKPGHSAPNAIAAGVAGGFLGTSTAIGGPPFALIMRGMSPERVRGTLSAVFVIGSTMSIALLALSGSLGTEHLKAAALFAPAVVVGFLLSGLVNRYMNKRTVYLGSVGISLIGAVAVVADAVGALG